MTFVPMGIDDPSVIPGVIAAIEEAKSLLPVIPSVEGRVVTPMGVGAVAKAIKHKEKYVVGLRG